MIGVESLDTSPLCAGKQVNKRSLMKRCPFQHYGTPDKWMEWNQSLIRNSPPCEDRVVNDTKLDPEKHEGGDILGLV